MADWRFVSNHGLILIHVARDPDARLRDVAAALGITERAAQRIVLDLEEGGVVTRTRVGRRNRYSVDRSAMMRHPMNAHLSVGDFLAALSPPS